MQIPRPRQFAHGMPRPEVWMIAVTLLAALFRFYNLRDFPPALYLDEAWDAYDALRILRNGSLYLFFGGSYGREPLMIHLQAISFFLFGVSAWSLRTVSAVAGVLAVPAIYRVSAELLRGTRRAKWLGVLAAIIFAVSFWHVEVSRLSPRVILVPLFGILAVWAFWRGWTTGRLRYAVWAGILVGASLYTYPAARLIPVLLVAFAAAAVVAGRLSKNAPQVNLRRIVVEIAVVAVVSGIVFVPLAIYYVQNPGAFYVRSLDTFILSPRAGDQMGQVGENLLRVVRLFVDRGDMNWRHNLPGRPAFDMLTTAGFWIGLAVALKNLPTTPVFLLIVLWLVLNLGPTALTVDSPHFLRAINALPAACILAAEGLTRLWGRLAPRVGWWPLLMIVVAAAGIPTFVDYNNIWGPDPQTYSQFDGSLDTFVGQVMSLSESSDVMIPMSVYGSPQMQFALAGRWPQQTPSSSGRPPSAAWVVMNSVERANAVIGPRGIYMPQPLDDAQVTRLTDLLRNGEPVRTRFGVQVATKLRLENDADFVLPIRPEHSLDADFGHMVRLIGYSFDRTILTPRDTLRITLYWQALQDLNSDYLVSCNMLDPFGESLVQVVSEPAAGTASTSLWRSGMVISDILEMQVPKGAHDGAYRVEVSLLDRKKADPLLPLSGSQDRLVLDPVMVMRTPVSLSAIANPVTVTFGEPATIALLGYELDERALQTGRLPITLYWRGAQSIGADFSVFIHVVDAGGKMIAQQDGPTQQGNAPTSWWEPGVLMQDVHTLTWPTELAPGNYRIELGVYDSTTGRRLPIFDSEGRRQPDDQWAMPIVISRP